MWLCIEIIHACTPKNCENTLKLKKKKSVKTSSSSSHKHGSRLCKPNSVLSPDAQLCKQPLLQFLDLFISVSPGPGAGKPGTPPATCARPAHFEAQLMLPGPVPLGWPRTEAAPQAFPWGKPFPPPAAAWLRSPASGASPSSDSF